jgi:nucleoside-diphosphate-sugar epimerase
MSGTRDNPPVKSLANSRVLVSGAAGFLGSHLCDRLREHGADVHAVSRSDRTGDAGGVRWWSSAFDDAAEIERILRAVRPDVVYPLGGHVTAAPEVGHVLPTFTSLLASTVALLSLAPELGVSRIVLAASSTEPRDESGAPGSPYAAAKWCATVYARMFYDLYRTPVVVTRPFMTYGPGQDGSKVVPYTIDSLLRGDVPRLSGGSLAADWIYVVGVVDGLHKAGTAPDAVGQEIELGTGTLTTVREVVERIVTSIEPGVEPEFGALPDRPKEEVRAADVDHSWARLGWRATTSLATGLERTIAWHRRRLGR